MSRVLTFSRVFPSYHPKAGEPTYFVEKIWASFGQFHFKNLEDKYCFIKGEEKPFWDINGIYEPKYHTIRAGNRWKAGDYFSPRVWSGVPYKSKMITIAPDIEIKKVWDFEIKCEANSEMPNDWSNFMYINNKLVMDKELSILSANDGLEEQDMLEWFEATDELQCSFSGQIICWNENINY